MEYILISNFAVPFDYIVTALLCSDHGLYAQDTEHS